MSAATCSFEVRILENGLYGKDKGSRLDLKQILRIISIFGSVAIP